jgi:hypothetical protein
MCCWVLRSFGPRSHSGRMSNRFVQNIVKRPMKKRPQERLTEHEKALIIQSYSLGINLKTLSGQIGKSRTSISTFYSRWKLDSTLPPKEKKTRSWIDGRMGLAIKKQVKETPKLGLRKMAQKLKEKLPNNNW